MYFACSFGIGAWYSAVMALETAGELSLEILEGIVGHSAVACAFERNLATAQDLALAEALK